MTGWGRSGDEASWECGLTECDPSGAVVVGIVVTRVTVGGIGVGVGGIGVGVGGRVIGVGVSVPT